MKRILIDARESGTSTGRYIDKLIEYLHQLKPPYDITVLTKASRLEFIQSTAPGFTVVDSPYPEFTFAEQLGFRRQIESLNPDLVHFGMVQQPVLYRGGVVTTIHDLTTTRFSNPSKNALVMKVKQWIYKRVIKRAANKSSLVITPTEFVRHDVINFSGAEPDKVVVTYEAADKIKQAAKPIEALVGKKFIMYVGRPTPHKNLGRLIEAFGILQKTNPELHLVLAGKKDSLYSRHEQGVQAKGIKNVLFTGFISEGELRWLYENTSAYVFPSLSEGFGLPGLEAMAHGAPVASSNATCLPEVYGDAAEYFDPLSVNDMAGAIEKVISNSTLTGKLRTAGLKQSAKYSWRRMAEQTLAVYDDVLKTD